MSSAWWGNISQALMMLVAWIAMIYFQQDSLVYHPRQYSEPLNESSLGPDFELTPLRFDTEDGKQSGILLRRTDQKTKRLFLVFGGNAMVARDWISVIEQNPGFVKEGLALALVDYPGFGESGGSPSRESIIRTGQAALVEADSVVRLSDDSDNDNGNSAGEHVGAEIEVGAIGHSIGCSAAVAVAAAQHDGGAPLQHLVLSAPFTSLSKMAQEAMWVLKALPLPLIEALSARHAWNTLEDAARLVGQAAPHIDIIHGDHDSIVPFAMGKEIHDLLRAKDMKTTFKRVVADHNDLLFTEDYMAWLEGILA